MNYFVYKTSFDAAETPCPMNFCLTAFSYMHNRLHHSQGPSPSPSPLRIEGGDVLPDSSLAGNGEERESPAHKERKNYAFQLQNQTRHQSNISKSMISGLSNNSKYFFQEVEFMKKVVFKTTQDYKILSKTISIPKILVRKSFLSCI